jgi:peptidyl-prolyl cis-trans isomerase D
MALGFMRRHRRWLYVFLWVVILGFIVFYIPAFTRLDEGSPASAVGSVSGIPITTGEFQRAYLQRRQLYEQLYQGRLDAAALRSLGLDEQVFEGLVAEKLVALEAQRLGLTVSDAELAQSLRTAPDLQENGRYIGDGELRRRLQLGGQSIAEFERSRRERLLAEKLEALVTGGVNVLPAEVEAEFRRRNEQLRAEYVFAEASRFRAEVTASDAEARARFETRKDSYRIPEKRVLSYTLVDPETLRAQVKLSDPEIEAYYQERRDEFVEPEQACASHVLVKVKATPEAPEGHADAEARTLAQTIHDRLAAGADFAATAKKESEDKGSAPGGGDLGCFPRGRMLPEFDNATFSLEAGQLSDVVRTSAGYHVIRLNSRKEETVRPLTQVREGIRQTLIGQRVRERAEEKVQRVAAALTAGKSLEDAARAEGLSLQRSQPIAAGESVEPLASPALVARAFEMKAGEIEKEPHGVARGAVFFALLEIQPARAAEWKDAQERVKSELLEEKALDKARLLAADVRSRAEKLPLEKAAAAAGLVRKETPALVSRGQAIGDLGTGAALESAAFALPEKTLSEPVRVRGGYAILRVIEKKSVDPAAFEQQKGTVAASLRDQRRSQFFQAYMNEARKRFKVERRAEALRRVTG